MVRRERKVDPVAMLWVLLLGFGVRLQRTLAGLKRGYETFTRTTLRDSSWYERFTPEFVAFLRACVALAIENLAAEVKRERAERLRRFKDLLIQDSTVVRLHEKLAKRWPATRARRVAAGVKVALLVSAVANGPKSIAIHGERTADVKTLRIGRWVRDCLLLLDLGFYKFQLFARIAENGGFFVTRLKEGANPLLRASHRRHRGCAIDLAGKRWREVEPLLEREVLDAEVEVAFSRRRYAEKRSRDAMRLRLVAVWNAEARRYHVYLTNVPPEVLTAEEVAATYAVRWDIELVFKELKSRYALDMVTSTNPHVVEALIWTAVLTLVVSRRMYNVIRAMAPEEQRARYTPLRWSIIFAENADRLRSVMLKHLGLARDEQEELELLMEIHMGHGLDPHVNRRRLGDRVWA